MTGTTRLRALGLGAMALLSTHAATAQSLPSLLHVDGFEAVVPVDIVAIQTGIATGNVSLRERVVTAVSNDRRALWIADAPQAAPFAGVYAVVRGDAPELAPGIVVGTRVAVDAEVEEVDGLTQLADSDVALQAPATQAPLPVHVTIPQVEPVVEGTDYEGVLVQLAQVKVVAAGPGLVVVHDHDGRALTLHGDAGGFAPQPSVGTCYAALTGVMHLHAVTSQRVLLPRSAADLVEGSGCD